MSLENRESTSVVSVCAWYSRGSAGVQLTLECPPPQFPSLPFSRVLELGNAR